MNNVHICEAAVTLGEIWWLTEPLDKRELISILDVLSTVGLAPVNPGTGARNFIDENGNQVASGMDSMVERWWAGTIITAQFWISSESDVLVTADRRQGVISLDLDGLTYLEAKQTVFASVGAAVTFAKTRSVVIEQSLPDSGEEWLSYFNANEGDPPQRPDLLLTTAEAHRRYSISVDPASWLAS